MSRANRFGFVESHRVSSDIFEDHRDQLLQSVHFSRVGYFELGVSPDDVGVEDLRVYFFRMVPAHPLAVFQSLQRKALLERVGDKVNEHLQTLPECSFKVSVEPGTAVLDQAEVFPVGNDELFDGIF